MTDSLPFMLLNSPVHAHPVQSGLTLILRLFPFDLHSCFPVWLHIHSETLQSFLHSSCPVWTHIHLRLSCQSLPLFVLFIPVQSSLTLILRLSCPLIITQSHQSDLLLFFGFRCTKLCAFKPYPDHPHWLRRTACQTPLLKSLELIGGRRILYPFLIYCYLGVEVSVQQGTQFIFGGRIAEVLVGNSTNM